MAFLERLLLLGAPLFAAAATGKRNGVKKSSRKKRTRLGVKKVRTQRRVHKISQSRIFKRAKKTGRRTQPVSKRSTARLKVAASARTTAIKSTHKTVAAPKTETTEPLPKPVAPSGRAILLSPENEKYADSVNPRFRWLSVGGATRYEVSWGDDLHWTSSNSVISIATEAGVPVEKPLRAGVTYFWRVRGGNEGGWGPWSSIGSFRVLEETA